LIRFTTPASDSFLGEIADDDFNIDTAQTSDEKEAAVNAKASKIWRTLRLASRNKLALFEKIDNGKNLEVLFESRDGLEEPAKVAEERVATTAQAVDDKENIDVPQQPEAKTVHPEGGQPDTDSVR
jgi:THO complex subunit 1